LSETQTAARALIEDADFAVESAKLAKALVLQRANASLIAQANASADLVLTLIED
jgi:flagellin